MILDGNPFRDFEQNHPATGCLLHLLLVCALLAVGMAIIGLVVSLWLISDGDDIRDILQHGVQVFRIDSQKPISWVVGVTFATFCVWLTVRIINRHERWAKQVAVATAIFAVGCAAFYALGVVLDYRFGGV
jgi:hypothetical protein